MKLRTVAQAQREALALAEPVDRTERVSVVDAAGRVLAAPAVAKWDLPGADVSIMDGWAVRSADVAAARACGNVVTLQIAGESAAGHPADRPLQPGEAMRISTGAVMGRGADAVIAQEDTRRDGDTLVVEASAGDVVPGTFVRPRGREVAEGDTLAQVGQRLRAPDIAALAGAGCSTLQVYARPRVAILSTGDELVPIGTTPRPGQVVSSNGAMLAAAVIDAGGIPLPLPDTVDDPAALRAVVDGARSADVFVSCGGISVGDHDHMLDVVTGLGGQVVVRGVALKPGKPTTIARLAATTCLLLPGNPASAWVSFHLFGRPVLTRRAGEQGPAIPPTTLVTLGAPVKGAGGRAHYVRARLSSEGVATPLSVQQSGNLRSLLGVDALVIVPPGAGQLAAGAQAHALVLRPALVDPS